MSEEKEGQGTGDEGNAQPAQGATEDRFKDDPKYQAMASQLAKFQKAESDRKEADAKAAKDAELSKLEAAQDYEAVKKVHAEEKATLEAKFAKDILERDLGLEMATAGFKSKLFIKGAILDYDPDTHTSPAEYVKGLVADESNKPFLSEGKPNVPPGPGKPGFSAGDPMNLEKYRAMQNGDEKERRAASKYSSDYFDKHNELPKFLQKK